MRKVIRSIIKESIKDKLFEYIDRDVNNLRRYLMMSDDEKYLDFISHSGDGDSFKSYLKYKKIYYDFLERYKDKRFFDWYGNDYDDVEWFVGQFKDDKDAYQLYVLEYGEWLIRQEIGEYDTPTYYFMENPKILKKQWLIHETDCGNVDEIVRDGFKYGIYDYTTLGLTTHYGEEAKKYGGYNFAFEPSYYDGIDIGKYGQCAVLFMSSGIEIYHKYDEERQIIFYGNSATDIIRLYDGNDKMYAIGDKGNDTFIVEKDTVSEIVEWLNNNYSRYKKFL